MNNITIRILHDWSCQILKNSHYHPSNKTISSPCPHVQVMFQLGNDEESLPAVCFLGTDHVPVDVIPKVEDVRTLSSRQLTEQVTVPTTVHFSLLWRDCQVCGTCWIVGLLEECF